MQVDFPTLLVAAAAITGLIWALDAWVLAPRRRVQAVNASGTSTAGEMPAKESAAREPLIVEYSRSFFPVILAVLLLRSFLVEPFRIPSGSMMPTLLVGDFILVNKFAYGLRLPVLNAKVVQIGEPQRGDVVVFRYPNDPGVDYIKRVVGVPGDHIAYYHKILYVNGVKMDQKIIGAYTGEGQGASMSGASLRDENLDGVEHRILIRPGQPGVEGEFVVPPGQYFVMGDNRDNSNDSRYWGTVPEGNLVGKAFFIWMNWDAENGGITWSRIGDQIQ